LVAVQTDERVELPAGLDTLANYRHAEGVGHCRYRSDDLSVARAAADLLYEAPIDLQDVDLQSLQVGKGRVPGPEVVEGKAHAEL
jgi:hypothetical protein